MTCEAKLTAAEVLQGAWIGVMRQAKNLQVGRKPGYGASLDNCWQLHCEGALAELAVAKTLGVYWAGALHYRGQDIAGFEVRSSPRPDASLILHPGDKDASIFVLVTGICGDYLIRGWQLAGTVKRQEFWGDRGTGRPAFFVPQSALRPMNELPGAVRHG